MTFPNVFSAIRSFFRVVEWKLRGWAVLVPPAEGDRRRAICESCPSKLYSPRGGQCIVCGCFVFAKVALASEECPKKHWFPLRVKLTKRRKP